MGEGYAKGALLDGRSMELSAACRLCTSTLPFCSIPPPPLFPSTQEAFKGLFRRLPNLQLAVDESQLEWSDAKGDVSLKALPVKW